MRMKNEFSKIFRIKKFCTLLLMLTLMWSCSRTPGNVKSPEAVREVMEGKRTEANAAWWGFDEFDATYALQTAINSGAKKVIVPNMGKDWIVRPINLAGDQELVFEEGVVVTAKRGEFRGRGASLFFGKNISNLTINGYGAIWRMQKQDYITGILGLKCFAGAYEKAEWRMTLDLRGCSNVKVFGLTLKDSGGDGIYIDGGGNQGYCRNIHIRDVVCDNNYRQGISVISVVDLLIENSTFKNTWGTPPSAGIDIEPDSPDQRANNIIIRNCDFIDNYGAGIHMYFSNQTAKSQDISILFENCLVTSDKGSGISIMRVKDDGPDGLIEFRDCVIENVEYFGTLIGDKSADRARVRFTNCTWRNVAKSTVKNYFLHTDSLVIAEPLWIQMMRPNSTEKLGGVDFIDCFFEDTRNRPFLVASEKENDYGLFDVTGEITVKNPYGAFMNLGTKTSDVTLNVISLKKNN